MICGRFAVFFYVMIAGLAAAVELEPYHIIDVHMEEGVPDAVEARRNWEESKTNAKSAADASESSVRAKATIESILTSQRLTASKITDLKKLSMLRSQVAN